MIQLFWVLIDEYNEQGQLGFMARVELPTGETVLFDKEKGKIDFEPLRTYIGHECVYYEDGVRKWVRLLKDIRPTKEGINALWFEDIVEQLNDEETSA